MRFKNITKNKKEAKHSYPLKIHLRPVEADQQLYHQSDARVRSLCAPKQKSEQCQY